METGLSAEEQLALAREERLNIVKRYERGREQGAVIDAWEDPGFELYHKMDRFGFIHDSRLPNLRSKEDTKKVEAEKSRSMKWAKMLRSWDKYRDTEKLTKRVYKGIPLSVRGCIWSKLLGLEVIKKQQKGKYEEIKSLGKKWSTDIRQIDLDVNRTYRDHEFFRLRYDIRQQQLFHVLVAYSMYNQEIGYCQGMSQIAALLLIYLNEEEDAFWALSALMTDEKYAMHGFFIPGFPKLLRFQQHHDKILEKFLPKLKKHLERNYVDAGLYTLKWFFQCFLDRVPFSLTMRLWDIYLLEGEVLLIAMAYTILKLHRRSIMRLDMDEILDYIQKRLEQNFGYEDDYVVEILEKCIEELKRAKLISPGPPPDVELPQKPFGLFVEPSIEKEVGLRGEPSEEEKRITKDLLVKQETLALNGAYIPLEQGSQISLDKSIDEVSSFEGEVGGSRVSLANTSLTSAAELSIWSSGRGFELDVGSIQSGGSCLSTARSPPPHIPKRRVAPKAVSDGASTESMNIEGQRNGQEESPPTQKMRPTRLSVSQTTLVRDFDAPLSDPTTPKASETPDAVRIYVPYGRYCTTPSPQFNTREDEAATTCHGGGDPYRITIQVDHDTSYSVLPSPVGITPHHAVFHNSIEHVFQFSKEEVSSYHSKEKLLSHSSIGPVSEALRKATPDEGQSSLYAKPIFLDTPKFNDEVS